MEDKTKNKEKSAHLMIEIPVELKTLLKIEAARRHTTIREIVLRSLIDKPRNIHC